MQGCICTIMYNCSISLTLPFDPRLFNGNKRGSTGRVKEIEQYLVLSVMFTYSCCILKVQYELLELNKVTFLLT